MSNLNKWLSYLEHVPAPPIYKKFGFFFLVASCLERRVWLGDPDYHPLYPNLYLVLVGSPGTGKGLVSRSVANMLDSMLLADGNDIVKRAANSTTFAAILDDFSHSRKECQNGEPEPYQYCHLVLLLEELGSVFKRQTEEVTKLLLETFDCITYRHRTRHESSYVLRNTCLNLLAGTTEDFLLDAKATRILGEGMRSRALWLHSVKPEKGDLLIAKPRKDQLACRYEIRDHLMKLIELYGQARISKEAYEWLEHWWQHAPSISFQDYEARRNIHVTKLAMVCHFSDNLSPEIGLDSAKAATAILEEAELSMTKAFSRSGKNPLSAESQKLLDLLAEKPLTHQEVLVELWDNVPTGQDGILEIINQLYSTGRIEMVSVRGESGYRLRRD